MKPLNGFLWADVAGLTLTSEDKEILSHPFISGVILFSRNYESIEQLRELTHQIQSVSAQLIITVDQEGGRVQRFREGFTELPAMGLWGSRYVTSPEKTKNDFLSTLKIMLTELQRVGVYSTLAPVLDIDYGRSEVIGHRSFSADKNIIVALSAAMIHQFHALQSPVTGKHFPGHGWVTIDSHHDLPVDERSLDVITQQDLQPFARLAHQLDAVMLAHVVYENVDPLPVCFSHRWIQDILRTQLKFDGLVMSDDLSMQAVAKMGSYTDRTERSLEAGCDIVLVCNAREGVVEILDHVFPQKNAALARRLSHYSRFLNQ